MPLKNIITRVAQAIRAGKAIDRARAVTTRSPPPEGGRRLGYVAVIGETFHAETPDGRSLGCFDTEDEAISALQRALGR